jgi:hypothetical protein
VEIKKGKSKEIKKGQAGKRGDVRCEEMFSSLMLPNRVSAGIGLFQPESGDFFSNRAAANAVGAVVGQVDKPG